MQGVQHATMSSVRPQAAFAAHRTGMCVTIQSMPWAIKIRSKGREKMKYRAYDPASTATPCHDMIIGPTMIAPHSKSIGCLPRAAEQQPAASNMTDKNAA